MLAGIAGAWRLEAAPAGTVTAAVVSQYMFRGLRYGGPALQPYVEFDSGNASWGVWASTPLAARVPGQSDPEVDPYGAYKIPLRDGLNLQPGFTWYTYPNADPARGFYRSTFEPSLALNYTGHGVTLTPKAYYDFVLHGPTFELTAASAVPLTTLGTELDLLATVGTYQWDAAVAHAAPDVRSRGDYWLVGATIPYQLTLASRVSVGFAYTRGSGNELKQGEPPKPARAGAAGRGVVTVTYSWSF